MQSPPAHVSKWIVPEQFSWQLESLGGSRFTSVWFLQLLDALVNVAVGLLAARAASRERGDAFGSRPPSWSKQ